MGALGVSALGIGVESIGIRLSITQVYSALSCPEASHTANDTHAKTSIPRIECGVQYTVCACPTVRLHVEIQALSPRTPKPDPNLPNLVAPSSIPCPNLNPKPYINPKPPKKPAQPSLAPTMHAGEAALGSHGFGLVSV